MPFVIRRKSTGNYLNVPRSGYWRKPKEHAELEQARVYKRRNDASNSVHITPEGDYEVVEVKLVLA